jgi:conjugative transposon TraN protein
MKTFQILRVLLLILALPALGQDSGAEIPVNREIGISEQQTTSLLFSYPIVSVDRGSEDILAQKPKGIENILQIKAAQQEFMQSNLTVVTADGKLYNFIIYYTPLPEISAYDFLNRNTNGAVLLREMPNAGELDALASKAYHDRERMYFSERGNGITLMVTGMFVDGDYFFYRVAIENKTNISYDIDRLRFLVRDQKRSRRTALQDLEIFPVQLYQPTEKIPANTLKSFVVVLPKFTIPDKKNLFLELTENSGGRHLQMRIRRQRAAEVTPLPTFKD